jgi:hypothetical protein
MWNVCICSVIQVWMGSLTLVSGGAGYLILSRLISPKAWLDAAVRVQETLFSEKALGIRVLEGQLYPRAAADVNTPAIFCT